MDIRTEKIYTEKELKEITNNPFLEKPSKRQKELQAAFDGGTLRPMNVPPTLIQRITGRVGRNSPCPCGSGKKFKKCCLLKAGKQ